MPLIDALQDPQNPNRWFFDFDRAAPGGRGGASLLLDPSRSLASFDGGHRNDLLPRRSTGTLLAEGLLIAGMPQPAIIEGNNIRERKTLRALKSGSDGQGTVIGNLFEILVSALGGVIVKWEPIRCVGGFHLWVHVQYP